VPWEERLREQALFIMEKRRCQEDLNSSLPTSTRKLSRRWSQVFSSGAWQTDKRQQTQVKWRGLIRHKKNKFLHYEDIQTVEQVAWRGYSVSVLRGFQDQTG